MHMSITNAKVLPPLLPYYSLYNDKKKSDCSSELGLLHNIKLYKKKKKHRGTTILWLVKTEYDFFCGSEIYEYISHKY